jgi:uncharacterized protein HemY
MKRTAVVFVLFAATVVLGPATPTPSGSSPAVRSKAQSKKLIQNNPKNL